MRSIVVVAAQDWKRISVAVWSSSKICNSSGSGTVVKFVLQGQVNMAAERLRRRIYLILFWHCTIRTSKKQDRLCVVKVKFHVFTCSKNMKSALSSFSPALIYVSISLILAHIQLSQLRLVGEDKANRYDLFTIYAPTQIIIKSASYEYCELE